VAQLEEDLAALKGCDAKIASGGGRMNITMDRYEARRGFGGVGGWFRFREGLGSAGQ
jgi:hypothetical protein